MGTGGRAVGVPQILLMVLQSLGGQSFGSGGKGTDPISDTPYGRERAASLQWREPHTGQGLRRIRSLCRTQGSFLGTTSGTASQTRGRHRAWHWECRKGLAEAAGLAQLCGFQRYLIDSSFLPLPPLPQSPHAFFMLTPPGQRLSAQEKKQKKPQNTTNRNQNLRLFLWSPEIVVV